VIKHLTERRFRVAGIGDTAGMAEFDGAPRFMNLSSKMANITAQGRHQ